MDGREHVFALEHRAELQARLMPRGAVGATCEQPAGDAEELPVGGATRRREREDEQRRAKGPKVEATRLGFIDVDAQERPEERGKPARVLVGDPGRIVIRGER